MKRCGLCNNELREKDKFCSKCGTPLPRDEIPMTSNDHPNGGRYETQQSYFGIGKR